MAATRMYIHRETFSCSICLDFLKEPVTIPCGHSYCMSCVDTHWNRERGRQSYSCPQCRQSFTHRPVLVKNTMLAALMEGLKKSGPPAAAVFPSSAAHGDVSCDLCSGGKVKAVKSCLQCLVSYCKEHLQPHYDVAALKRHKLVEPSENLQDNICSLHDEVKKMFCRSDQQCICYLCSVDQHKGHDTVTAAAERAEKQKQLQIFKQKLIHRIELKHKDVSVLQHQVKNNSRSVDEAVMLSDRSLKELVLLLEKRMSEMKQQLRSQHEAEEHRLKDLQNKVDQDIVELQKKLTEVDALSQTEDHVQFLLKATSLTGVGHTSDSLSSQSSPPFVDMVTAAVSELRRSVEETRLMDPPAVGHQNKINSSAGAKVTAPSQQQTKEQQPVLPQHNQELKNAAPNPQLVQKVTLNPAQIPTTCTAKIKKCARKISWDARSLNEQLELSNDNTVVKRLPHSQHHKPHPFRFTHFPQAVSKQALTGQCYFEVFTHFENTVTVGVAYKDIPRNGPSGDCSLGMNDKSWALECTPFHSVVWHDGNKVEIPRASSVDGNLVGVFLNYKEGLLAFYRRSLEFELIYTFQTTFTQALVAAVRLDDVGSTGRLCQLD